MTFLLPYNHGDRVIVLDRQGNHECRGRIQGRADTSSGPVYDIQPDGESSLSMRRTGIPASLLRPIGKLQLVKRVSS